MRGLARTLLAGLILFAFGAPGAALDADRVNRAEPAGKPDGKKAKDKDEGREGSTWSHKGQDAKEQSQDASQGERPPILC